MGEFFHQKMIMDFDGAEFCYLSHIVPGQVHQHIVFCQFLGIRLHIPFQGFVLLSRLPSPPGAGDGHGGDFPVLDLDQSFWRRTGDFHLVVLQQHHVLGRIGGPEDPVHVEQILIVGSGEPLGIHRLENISLPDMFLDFFHISCIGLFILVAGDGSQLGRSEFRRNHWLPDQGFHGIQVLQGLGVIPIQVVGLDVYDQVHFLEHPVEGNHLVEEHQVEIWKVRSFSRIEMEAGFTILEEIIGEISHEPAGKRRQPGDLGNPIGLQDGPESFQGLFGVHRDLAAGKFHLGTLVLGPEPGNGVESDERIPAGLVILFQAFQQEVPAAFLPHQAHQPDGGSRICQDFPDHWHRRISLGQGFDFFQTLLFHFCSSSLIKEKYPG